MRVCFRAQYLSQPVANMRHEDYDATMLVHAVKGDPLPPKQWTKVTVGGKRVRVDHANTQNAVEWFAEWASDQIDGLGHGPKILIPIPGSSTLAASPANFRTAILARRIAAHCWRPTVVVPWLRFRDARTSSHGGGTRNPQALYENMTHVGELPAGEIVLIDDVYTTGAHMRAAAWELHDVDREPVLGLSCGRTLHAQLDDPFAVESEDLGLQIKTGGTHVRS